MASELARKTLNYCHNSINFCSENKQIKAVALNKECKVQENGDENRHYAVLSVVLILFL